MILRSEAAGTYVAYGFYTENTLVAYAYLCGTAGKPELPVLLDYLAVVKEHRGEGYGSAVLAMLKDELPQGMMIEAESIANAENEEEGKKLKKILLAVTAFFAVFGKYLHLIKKWG